MNNIFVNPEIKLALSQLFKKLRLNNSVTSEVLVKSSTGLVLHTRLQFLFNYKPNSVLESKLYELILSFALDAERQAAGAFDAVMSQLLQNYPEIEMDIPASDFIESYLHPVEILPASLSDVSDIVVEKLRKVDSSISSVFLEAVKLAGFGGRIIVEKTHSQIPSVELNCGYSFDIKPAWPLSVKLKDAKIFVIDGFIESVSEIHHILEKQFESKDCSIIFARGMSPDVISTLKVNFDRGSLKAVPVIVNFDLDGINTVNDIAVVSGGDVVSSNKGNLISSIDYGTIPSVDFVSVYPTKIIIQHNKTSRAVALHTFALKNKRAEKSSIEDISKLYDKRIRSLSPNHVIIRIPDNKNYVVISQAIDFSLRTLKSLVDYGAIEKNGKKVPAALEFAANTFANKCLDYISNLGAITFD